MPRGSTSLGGRSRVSGSVKDDVGRQAPGGVALLLRVGASGRRRTQSAFARSRHHAITSTASTVSTAPMEAPMDVRYMVELTDGERAQLQELADSGNAWVRRVKRAQILLAAQQGYPDAVIAQTVAVGTSTVYRTKRCFVECGLEGALSEDPRPGARRKLTGREETLLVAMAFRARPRGGRAGRWNCWPMRWSSVPGMKDSRESRRWPPDSSKSPSGIPGAVHPPAANPHRVSGRPDTDAAGRFPGGGAGKRGGLIGWKELLPGTGIEPSGSATG